MTNEILIGVVLVLPGFLTLYLIRKLSIQDEKSHGQVVYLWSLFLSVIIFVIFSFIVGIKSSEDIESIIFDYKKIVLLYLLALIVGVILGFISKKVIHGDYKALPGEVWSFALKRLNKDEGKFVLIFTTDNLEFSGIVRMYSTSGDFPREVLIEDPVQIIRDEKMVAIGKIKRGKEILFTESDIKRIVFYESTKEEG